MKERRYGWLEDPLLHLVLIGILVASLGAWRASAGRRSVIGPEARVVGFAGRQIPDAKSPRAEPAAAAPAT